MIDLAGVYLARVERDDGARRRDGRAATDAPRTLDHDEVIGRDRTSDRIRLARWALS
ncbi:MAG: hypothetical protein WKG01_10630 [Kofleriaceae bacterium]